MPNILEVLEQNGQFDYFLKACREGGLEPMLSEEGDWTIFAPNDQAFQNLSSIELKGLFEESSRLMNLVLLHTVEWGLRTTDILQSHSKKLRIVGEDDISLKIKKKTIFLEKAKILEPNIYADNGIIHVIDEVILTSDLWGK